MVLMPAFAHAYELVQDGIYKDSNGTYYINSWISSIEDLNVSPAVVYCYAQTPPLCNDFTFNDYGGTLHVPTLAMAAYFTAPYWYNFTNVIADAVEPYSVSLPESIQIGIGQQRSLNATVSPNNATPNVVEWVSTDASVATVTDGTVNAVGIGECDIIASCVDKQAECHVSVTPIITFNTHKAKVLPNHLVTLDASVTPANTPICVVSSNPSVAIARVVNGTIQVLGVSKGTAIITVNSDDGTAVGDECEVTVYTEIGDVDGDGYVTINDVTALIDCLLYDTYSDPADSDINRDGAIDINDVTALIDYLLEGIWPWRQEFTVNGVSFAMIKVEGGTFMMGATEEQGEDATEYESPVHQVTLSSYWIAETEVTQELWQSLMTVNPSYYVNPKFPVERISWEDCKTFISKLNQMTGMTFRLPTEAEWEFAARGGIKSKGYKYAGSNDIDDVAWYIDNRPTGYAPNNAHQAVATKMANELGLYDMSGNVLEWCLDWFGAYNEEAQVNPTGPSTGTNRVLRGGSWRNQATRCRVSYRGTGASTYSGIDIGLRLAL